MIKDDGSQDMRGIDYVKARARKCPRCKQDIEVQRDTKPQQHTCGMKWSNVARNGKLVGYDPIN